MRKKNLISIVKNWLAFGVTILLLIVLFGIIFITLGLAQPGPSFFLELGVIAALSFTMRVIWYDLAEDKRLSEEDILSERANYLKIVDSAILDTNDFDEYLVVLNQENKEHYIKNKLGSRTPSRLAKKTKFMCLIHPSYRNKTKEEIGQIRYDKLLYKIQRKADKLRVIKSEEIMALSDGELLYDAKNYTKIKKRSYQIGSTILSTGLTIVIACMAFDQIRLNWENVFKYLTYLFTILSTITTTVFRSYKTTGDETFDWFNRLKLIVDKYACYKENQPKEVKEDGVDSSDSERLCGSGETIQ